MMCTRPATRAGLTAHEFLAAWLAIFLGLVGALHGREFGCFGAVLGFTAGVAATLGVFFVRAVLYDLIWGGLPPTPDCRCGVRDYDHLTRLKGGEYASRCCQCSRTYQRRGRRFVEVDWDGSPRSHLKWVPFLGWKEDAT